MAIAMFAMKLTAQHALQISPFSYALTVSKQQHFLQIKYFLFFHSPTHIYTGRAQGPVYSCPNVGDVCTNLGLICGDPESNSNVQADCGNTEQCERCTGVSDGSYACTTHNTFVMCQSDTPTSVTGTCPKNEVCLTSRAKDGINPCANQCLSNILDMCDIVSPNATTVMPPTETTTTKAPTIVTTQSPTTQSGSSAGTTLGVDNNVCANQTLVGRYQNPSDTTCRT